MRWHLYVIRTVDNCLYTGVTTDVKRRFAEHKGQGPRTAKYLLAHRPAALAFSRAIGERSLALKVEYRFKQLVKREKESVIKRRRLAFDRVTGRIRMSLAHR
jgi:putative endonuclease